MLVSRPLAQGVRASGSCPAGIAVGDLVCVVGGLGIGNVYNVDLADPRNYERMPVVAVVLSKPTTTTCLIQFRDEVRGLYSGLTTGKVYFVGNNGRPSLTPPTAGVGGKAYVQSIGVAVDPEVLRLEPLKNMVTRCA